MEFLLIFDMSGFDVLNLEFLNGSRLLLEDFYDVGNDLDLGLMEFQLGFALEGFPFILSYRFLDMLKKFRDF
jgi:hypothetical protein